MKKRWIGLLVENEIGVLAKVSGLFSGKSYNLISLTVGITEDPAISRMTIGLISDDQTFEQVKKQLNRCVEIIKVVDYTDIPILLKELMFVKINHCSSTDMEKISELAQKYHAQIADSGSTIVLLESVQATESNHDLAAMLQETFVNRCEIVRGGSVGIEAIDVR